MLSAQSLNHRDPHAHWDLASQIPLTLTVLGPLNLSAPELTCTAADEPVSLSVLTNFPSLSAAYDGG